MSYEHILIEAEDGVGIVTLRWREKDSNCQFRARRNLGIPLELN